MISKIVFAVTMVDLAEEPLKFGSAIIAVFDNKQAANDEWLALNSDPEKQEGVHYFVEEAPFYKSPSS